MLVAPSVSDSEPATINQSYSADAEQHFIAVVTLWNVIVTFGNIVMGLLVCYQLAWS